MRPAEVLGSRQEVTLCLGQFHATGSPTLVRTLLGSCIAVCLWDPERRVGGMNHFMLPRGTAAPNEDSARFGVQAMELLMGAMLRAGADRRRWRTKVFGGGHVLGLPDSPDSVPRQNVAFIRAFLREEGFSVSAEDVGGHVSRHVLFQTDTGRVWVRRRRSVPRALAVQERAACAAPVAPPAFGEVTLF